MSHTPLHGHLVHGGFYISSTHEVVQVQNRSEGHDPIFNMRALSGRAPYEYFGFYTKEGRSVYGDTIIGIVDHNDPALIVPVFTRVVKIHSKCDVHGNFPRHTIVGSRITHDGVVYTLDDMGECGRNGFYAVTPPSREAMNEYYSQ